jgi:hypothetical protein
VSEWLTIEVFDGAFPASQWRFAHSESLLEAAITHGALDWVWHEHRWGVVLELEFADDERRDRFRSLATVRAALDAVPDPLSGLLVYRGRGGGSGARVPRRPKPAPMAGAATADVPEDVVIVLEYAVDGIQRHWSPFGSSVAV